MSEPLVIKYALEKGWDDQPFGIAPGKSHEDDFGWDFFLPEDVELRPMEATRIRLGVYLQLPAGWGMLLRDRSSAAANGVFTHGGVIDPAYRGEISLVVTSLTKQKYYRGDRISQGILIPIPTAVAVEIPMDQLSSTPRGPGGFGSTGK